MSMINMAGRFGTTLALSITTIFPLLPIGLTGCVEVKSVAPTNHQSLAADDEKDFEDFTAARELWFEMTATQADIRPSAEFPHVFAVIMDWPIKGKRVLVGAAADGTSSLYISPGPKVLGGYSAKKKAKAVIAEAEQVLGMARRMTDHPLPAPGEVRFYIRTFDGLYMISDSFEDLSRDTGKTLQLFRAANEVMTVHLDSLDSISVRLLLLVRSWREAICNFLASFQRH